MKIFSTVPTKKSCGRLGRPKVRIKCCERGKGNESDGAVSEVVFAGDTQAISSMVCGRVFEIKAHSHILAHKTLQNAFVCVCVSVGETMRLASC